MRRKKAVAERVDGMPDLREQFDKVAASVPGLICSFRLRQDGTDSMSMPYASPAIVDLFGLHPEDVATDAGPIFACMPPDDQARVAASVLESARTMTQWRDEWRFEHPVKGLRWMEGCSMPVPEADGSILWHGYVQDITERKEREQTITDLNLFQRLTTDAVPALISYVDADRRYRMVNRAYERWFGCRAGDIEGRLAKEVLGDAAWKMASPYVDRALAGESVEYEAALPYKDGGERWVRASYLPDIAPDGRVRGFVVMVLDLTERRRIEEDLRRSRQMFVDLMARQDGILESERKHMAREVHDELGQLLTGMRMALSALRMRGNGVRKTDVIAIADQLGRLLDEATGVVRRISSNLRPVLLEHGLLPAIEALATDFRTM
ncbi:MAG: PAS domain-containing protein, partial [Rhodocyclaceae bacterium]|nr:PAS domain-containing protein [Rhodocyclaceae bacterium]